MAIKHGILTLAVSLAVAACNTASTSNSGWPDSRGVADSSYDSRDRVVSAPPSALTPDPGPYGQNQPGPVNRVGPVTGYSERVAVVPNDSSQFNANNPDRVITTPENTVQSNGKIISGQTTVRTDDRTRLDSQISSTPNPNAPTGSIEGLHQPLPDNPQSPGAGKQRDLGTAMSELDRQFIITVMAGSQFEIKSSDKVASHSNSQQVKTLAQYMIDDHTKASAQLNDLASRRGFTAPVGVTTDQTDMLARLDKLNGAEFDAEYLRQQKQAHESTIAAFQDESTRGDDRDLRDWASATLPTLRNHLDMINALNGANSAVGMVH